MSPAHHDTITTTWSRNELRALARRWRLLALLGWALLAIVVGLVCIREGGVPSDPAKKHFEVPQ